jgi:hypothetical protein
MSYDQERKSRTQQIQVCGTCSEAATLATLVTTVNVVKDTLDKTNVTLSEVHRKLFIGSENGEPSFLEQLHNHERELKSLRARDKGRMSAMWSVALAFVTALLTTLSERLFHK